MKILGLPLLVLLVASIAAGCLSCRHDSASAALVVGTVLDAATGAPLAGAHVTGPHGTATESGKDGRFELDGLAPGDSGEVAARMDDGRAGKIPLRPLEPGRLEVVLHLSRP